MTTRRGSDPLSIPFGPLGDAEGIPSEVFATADGRPFSAPHAVEILEAVNADFVDDSILARFDALVFGGDDPGTEGR